MMNKQELVIDVLNVITTFIYDLIECIEEGDWDNLPVFPGVSPPSANPVPTPTVSLPIGRIIVTAYVLSIRNSPNVSLFNRVGYAKLNDQYDVWEESPNHWYRISSPGETPKWISGSYAKRL